MGSSALSLTLLLMSFIHSGLTQDSPRSTLTVTPDKTVFTGERVRLTCVIESNSVWSQRNGLTFDRIYDWTPEWRYEWYKDSVILQSSEHLTVDRNTLTIEGSESSDAGQYTCEGHIEGRSVSSQSSSVSLSVKALPRSTLTVTPDNTVFTGERVILTCVINPDHRDWRYEWYKGSVKLQSSERYTVNTDTLTIRAVTTSDAGDYWCRGHIEGRSVSTQSSSAVSLSVTDLPKPELTVDRKSPVFTGETVNLTCVIESNHTDWRYEWNKDSVKLQSSDRYTVNTDTLTIRGLNESDGGQFWCRGQRDGRPNSSQESERIDLAVNVSRSAQISFFIIPGFLLAACPYLLATVVLLYKCSRARVKSPEAQRQSL